MLLLGLMAEEVQGCGGWQGEVGQGLLGPSCLPSPAARSLLAALVVNGNLQLVSMAAGKINADEVTQEGEETLMAPGHPHPHLTWHGRGGHHPSPA